MINQKIIFYYVIFSWIGLWASLGSNPYDFLFILEKEGTLYSTLINMNFNEVINFLRSIFIPFSLFISLLILTKFRENKIDKLILLLIFIQLAQIISTFLSYNTSIAEIESKIDHVGRYFWTISSLSLLAIYLISCKIGVRSNKIIFYISIIFLTFITFFFSYKIVSDFLFLASEKSVYHLSIFRESAFFLSHEIPRITGLSRTIIFLYIIILFFKSNLEIYNNYIKYLFLGILGALVILYQSKFGVISFLLINTIYIYISKNKLKTLKLIFFLFIFQLTIIFSIVSIKVLYNKYFSDYWKIQKIEKYTLDENILERIPQTKKDKTINQYNFLRKYPLSSRILRETKFPLGYSIDGIIFSGRVKLWIETVKFSLKKPFLGYGSMADRIFLNYQKTGEKKFIQPVSNAYIYAFVSGGTLSLFLIVYFWKLLINRNILIFQKKTFFTNKNKIGYMLILFIFLRTLIENSMMLFGIDFILLIHGITLIKNK